MAAIPASRRSGAGRCSITRAGRQSEGSWGRCKCSCNHLSAVADTLAQTRSCSAIRAYHSKPWIYGRFFGRRQLTLRGNKIWNPRNQLPARGRCSVCLGVTREQGKIEATLTVFSLTLSLYLLKPRLLLTRILSCSLLASSPRFISTPLSLPRLCCPRALGPIHLVFQSS